MKGYLFFALACAVVLVLPARSSAQEQGAEVGAKEAVEYSYGTVVSVNEKFNEITISEYDWESDSETNVTYLVDPAVKVEDAPSWQKIPAGSFVDIEYVVKDGKKIAKYIGVYIEETTE